MRRAWLPRALVGLALTALPLATTGCTSVVAGQATAAPPPTGPTRSSPAPDGPAPDGPVPITPADPAPPAPGSPNAGSPDAGSPAPGARAPGPGPLPGASLAPRAGLVADPIADECLLNASEFGALVGGPVRPPREGTVDRGDGTRSSSCVATSGREPVATMNVYTVRSGTPADYVRAGGAAGRRALPGVGEAAVVIDTETGPTLQLASPRYLVTILVAGRTPSDEAWRTAALAALSRLPA